VVAAGVEQVQGFLIARPMPASDVRRWHAEWSAGNAPPA
jgi:EAL domain-containing protein (putative c-di-GMP-specific phosphodiesterase class I)